MHSYPNNSRHEIDSAMRDTSSFDRIAKAVSRIIDAPPLRALEQNPLLREIRSVVLATDAFFLDLQNALAKSDATRASIDAVFEDITVSWSTLNRRLDELSVMIVGRSGINTRAQAPQPNFFPGRSGDVRSARRPSGQ